MLSWGEEIKRADTAEAKVVELEKELRNWQRFASYCRSCALSGEHDPQDFCDFVRDKQV